jgi:hypothetical protein
MPGARLCPACSAGHRWAECVAYGRPIAGGSASVCAACAGDGRRCGLCGADAGTGPAACLCGPAG